MYRIHRILLSVLLPIILAGCSSWFYGTSNYPEPALLPKVVHDQVQTQIVWRYGLGEGDAASGYILMPDQVGNHIFAVSADGHFYRLDAQTGKPDYHIRLGNQISSGVTAGGGAIFLGAANGDLIALAQADGRILWRSPLGSIALARPVFSDGTVFVKTVDGSVSAWDPADGMQRWRYTPESPNLMMRGSSPVLPGGGVVLVTTDLGDVVVLDEKTGLVIARSRVAVARVGGQVGIMTDQHATPKVNNATLFGSVYQTLMYAFDLQHGGLRWQNDHFSTLHDFAISPADIYLTDIDDKVVSLSQNDGRLRWQNTEFSGRRLSPPLAIPGRVGVLDLEGYLSWLDSDDGTVIGQMRLGKTRAGGAPLVLDNLLVWQLSDGQLVAFRPK